MLRIQGSARSIRVPSRVGAFSMDFEVAHLTRLGIDNQIVDLAELAARGVAYLPSTHVGVVVVFISPPVSWVRRERCKGVDVSGGTAR